MLSRSLVAVLVTLSAPRWIHAIELQPATAAAWDDYIQTTDHRMQDRLDGGRSFLWIDESPDRAGRLQRGEVIVIPVVGHGTQAVPDGLIHHWIGAIFLPGITIASLTSVVHDYDAYERMYKPVVVRSRALGCAAADREFSMTWQRRVLFVNAAMQGQYWSRDDMLDERRGYEITGTTRLQEIENYGHSDARLMPPDTGSGFIWRLRSLARYEERDGGVYLELEAIALTRDIPASLRWLVTPMVNHLSINSLATTLRQTRQAVHPSSSPQHPTARCHSAAPIVGE